LNEFFTKISQTMTIKTRIQIAPTKMN